MSVQQRMKRACHAAGCAVNAEGPAHKAGGRDFLYRQHPHEDYRRDNRCEKNSARQRAALRARRQKRTWRVYLPFPGRLLC